MRVQAHLRAEFDQFRLDAQRKEELFHESIEVVQIKLTKTRLRTKGIIAGLETKVQELTQAAVLTQTQLAQLQHENERLQLDMKIQQTDQVKSETVAAELADAEQQTMKLTDSLKTAQRQIDRLEKKLITHEQILIEHGQLQSIHVELQNELASISSAYEQLHSAYSSEEVLYKDAIQRIQQLEHMIQEQKSAHSGVSVVGSPKILVTSPTPIGDKCANDVEHESLLSDLLDVVEDEPNQSTPGQDVPLPPQPHQFQQPPSPIQSNLHSRSDSATSTPSGGTGPISPPPISSTLIPSIGSIHSPGGSVIPSSHSQSKRSSVSSSMFPSLSQLTGGKMFHPDGRDAEAVNFHFFQLVILQHHQGWAITDSTYIPIYFSHQSSIVFSVLFFSSFLFSLLFVQVTLSVASHLSSLTEFSSISSDPLPVTLLYQEAMEKQIQANKVSNNHNNNTDGDVSKCASQSFVLLSLFCLDVFSVRC